MSKKAKILISVLAAVVLLVAGTTAVIAAGSDNQSATKNLPSRIADKLGVTEDELKSAISQAQADQRNEALSRFLDKAAQSGKLTQDEATQIKTWWQNRPAVVDKVFPGVFGAPFMAGRKMVVPFSDNRTPPRAKMMPFRRGR